MQEDEESCRRERKKNTETEMKSNRNAIIFGSSGNERTKRHSNQHFNFKWFDYIHRAERKKKLHAESIYLSWSSIARARPPRLLRLCVYTEYIVVVIAIVVIFNQLLVEMYSLHWLFMSLFRRYTT